MTQTREKFGEIAGIVKLSIKSITGVLIAYFCFYKTLTFVSTQNPDAIDALATFASKCKLPLLLSGAANLILGTAVTMERNGKKRAIREKGTYQKKYESSISDRTTSGLTPTGNTPVGAGSK